MIPIRIQRRRIKGWRMPENTIYVGRPTKWGNPAIVQGRQTIYGGHLTNYRDHRQALEVAVRIYRDWLEYEVKSENPFYDLSSIRGLNLCCWCPLNQPCHADVLLELANELRT